MKTKVFTKNKNGKIEFTEKELKALLDEIYDDGYADGSKKYYYTTPYYYHTPYWYTTTPLSNMPSSVSYTTTASSDGDSGVTITSGSYTTDSTVATINDSKQGGKKSTYKYIIKGNK